MVHTRDIHGHKVLGEDNTVHGMDYLDHDLDFAEAEVFFTAAKQKGPTQFEDDHDHQFTLSRNSDGTYQLTTRKKSSGLFGGWF
jgi:hypothetical protein